jgi:anti-sigma factor RsiW
MNREEAQFVLGAYRPNSEDAHDPQFHDALELARRDPELARWFAEQQALDRALSAKIRSRPVSPDLKAQLLLARTTARRRAAWWRQPVWLAAAAGLAVLLAVSGAWLTRGETPADFAGFRAAMAAAASDISGHADVWGLDNDGYRKWLAENRGAADFVLPASLADKAIAACKIVGWEGRKVTMLCLKVGGRHVDVFVVNASELPGVRLDATPQFFAAADLTSAAWQRDGKIYLAAGAMPKADLQQLL